jgi:hypothetical protein
VLHFYAPIHAIRLPQTLSLAPVTDNTGQNKNRDGKTIVAPFLNAAGLTKNLLAVYYQYLVLHSGDMRRKPDA